MDISDDEMYAWLYPELHDEDRAEGERPAREGSLSPPPYSPLHNDGYFCDFLLEQLNQARQHNHQLIKENMALLKKLNKLAAVMRE